MFAATFSKWCIITAFKINQQYITKELCVNKANPVMHCNGNCYLSKQLNKEEKPSSPFATNNSEKFEVQLFCKQLISFQHIAFAKIDKKINQVQNFTPQEFTRIDFPPPKA